MAAYERIMPGSAGRLLAMAEKVATGRIDNETKLIDAEIETARQGQIFAYLLTSVTLMASVVFFVFGNNFAGAALVGLPVVMLIKSFLSRWGQGGKDGSKDEASG